MPFIPLGKFLNRIFVDKIFCVSVHDSFSRAQGRAARYLAVTLPTSMRRSATEWRSMARLDCNTSIEAVKTRIDLDQHPLSGVVADGIDSKQATEARIGH